MQTEAMRRGVDAILSRKDRFEQNPFHWTNNKRRMNGLKPLRKPVNHKFRTSFFYNCKNDIFNDLEETVVVEVEDSIKNDLFNHFANVKDISIGDVVYF